MSEREATAYRAVRERTIDVVRGASTSALEDVAPATPQWRVRDVLAHMVGVPADALAGRLDGVATDPWTAAQVDARRAATVAEMLDEWRQCGAQFDDALVAITEPTAKQAVLDAITHEQDIRHALGVPGARDSDAVEIGFEFCCYGRTANQLPALRVVTDRGVAVAGDGEPVATVETSRFEFVRASTGRRSAEEVAAYRWDGDIDPAMILVAPIFTMRSGPLGE
jgi:uncharacterized protein (TIGR03083 family)